MQYQQTASTSFPALKKQNKKKTGSAVMGINWNHLPDEKKEEVILKKEQHIFRRNMLVTEKI